MADPILQNELNKVVKLITKLDPYWQREIRELPQELRDELARVKVLPSMTTEGLETVSSVLTSLYIAKIELEEEIQKDEKPMAIVTPEKIIYPEETEELRNKETEELKNRETPVVEPAGPLRGKAEKPFDSAPSKILGTSQGRPTPQPPKASDKIDFGPYAGK